jgi:acetyltransferase-like isoleucine patch superfamily enzyme
MCPAAALSGFGRMEGVYTLFAHATALIPGVVGDYLRAAYYAMTLTSCALDFRIGFGSYFAHPQATVAPEVGIGAYCVLGRVNLGERCGLASSVQILSGPNPHVRDAVGRIRPGRLAEVNIGADCWIGAAAIVMADVGPRSTIAAGAVVGTPVPADATAAGNPARVVRVAMAKGATA